jgi:Fe-S oxidoreductase
MATYKAEFLSHHYRGRLRPRAAYAMGLIHWWARLASRVPRTANAVAHAPVASGLLKRAGGVARERDVPPFCTQTFREWFRHRPPMAGARPEVVVWPDTFTTYFRPEAGMATVEALEHAGFRPVLPDAILCCGRPLYDYGMLDLAERLLRRTLRVLRPKIRAGVPVVGVEPSCLAVFRDELPNLLPRDDDARRLSKQSFVLSEFLQDRAEAWELPRLERSALVQPHCHHHAVMGFDAERELLKRIGLDATIPDAGCCGMAGSFGFEAGEKYRVAMACGERVLLPEVRRADDSTLIMADGFSCKTQIEQATPRRALHVAEVLRLAYRYGPEGPPGLPEDHVSAV